MSRLLPGLVGTASLRDQVMRRFANFYNGLSQGKNNKMKLICNISTYNDHRRKGRIGEDVECTSRLLNCSYDYLRENTASTVDVETNDRVRAKKKLTKFKDLLFVFWRPSAANAGSRYQYLTLSIQRGKRIGSIYELYCKRDYIKMWCLYIMS